MSPPTIRSECPFKPNPITVELPSSFGGLTGEKSIEKDAQNEFFLGQGPYFPALTKPVSLVNLAR